MTIFLSGKGSASERTRKVHDLGHWNTYQSYSLRLSGYKAYVWISPADTKLVIIIQEGLKKRALIVHFRVHYDHWIKEVKTHFLQPEPPSEVIYSQISTRKRHVYNSVVYIQISNTYLPEFPNILLYVEANPVYECVVNVYQMGIFLFLNYHFRYG